MTQNKIPTRKKRYQISLLIMVIILIHSLLFESLAFAENIHSFKNGILKSEHFSINIPDSISTIRNENDSFILLHSEKEDIFFSFTFGDATGIAPEQILDYAKDNVDVTDKTCIARQWVSSDNLDLISSTLKQTAIIDRNDIEMLEYRFDAKFDGQPWIAYSTLVHIKDSNHICDIDMLADNKRARTAILHYITIIDSITVDPSANLGEGEWLCENCGAVNSDNFCSKCGTKKPGSSFSSETTTSPAETQPVSQPETSINNSSTSQRETSAPYDSIISIAKELSGLIAYNAKAPADSNTVSVTIEGKNVLVHADFKYAMDVFYEFYKEYFDSLKNYNIGKMTSLALKADEVDAALEKIDDMELSDGDMAYYMSIYTKILQIIGDLGRN